MQAQAAKLSAALTPVSDGDCTLRHRPLKSTISLSTKTAPARPAASETAANGKAEPSFTRTQQLADQQHDRWQTDFPLAVISVLLLLDFMGVEQARMFTRLQYRQPAHHGLIEDPTVHPLESFSPVTSMADTYYRIGRRDVFFVAYMTLTLTLLRASIMRYILLPLGRIAGIRSRGRLERFKEQGYLLFYYATSWSWGMYLMYHSPYWFDTSYFWINYPHRDMTWHFKVYYLTSLAYAFHLMYVLHIEAKRKDYKVMAAHHVVTAILIASSYATSFTRIGNAVLCVMDFSDIILSLAKCLRYAKFQKSCDIMFGIFVLSWLVTRHVLYGIICWATYWDADRYIRPHWDPSRGIFLTYNTLRFFIGLFLALQLLIIYWFALICRVAWRVVSGSDAHDNRSSGSESGSEHEEEEMEKDAVNKEADAMQADEPELAPPGDDSGQTGHALADHHLRRS